MPTHQTPAAPDFRAALSTILGNATREGAQFADVKSGDLHRKVGGYPGTDHRMPICCSVMRSEMKVSDRVLTEPPKGKGATLLVRYHLPR
jgi:5-methylcytosine-specific restriction protein A